LLNPDLVSGDFSNLSTLYAPDAVLTQSSPLGVTKVYRGRAAIMDYYKALYARVPGLHFTVASQRLLAPAIVLRYMRAATPSMTAPARCLHVFVIDGGMISTEEWTVYFAGK
jgi:hypothetical protein